MHCESLTVLQDPDFYLWLSRLFPTFKTYANYKLTYLTTDCNRLFPSRDRIMFHRKRDHDTEDDKDIITWNE